MANKIAIRAPHHKKILGYVYIHTKEGKALIDDYVFTWDCKTCGDVHSIPDIRETIDQIIPATQEERDRRARKIV